MTLYQNLKTGTKLYIGFGIIILLSTILGVFSNYVTKNIDSKYSYLEHAVQKRLLITAKTEAEFANARRASATMPFFQDNPEKVKEIFEQYLQKIETVKINLNTLSENYEADDTLSQSDKSYRLTHVNELLLKIDEYKNNCEDLSKSILAKDTAKTQEIIEYNTEVANSAAGIIETLGKIGQDYATESSKNLTIYSEKNAHLLLIITFLIITFSLANAIIITNIIKKPLLHLSEVAKKIARGDLSVKANINQKNEIGELSKNINEVVNNFNVLLSEINNTSQKMESGDIDAKINLDRFEGDYQKVAKSINHSYADISNELMLIINAIQKYANGDFSYSIKRLPGKKAMINDAFDSIQNYLISINNDINNMINKSSEGDFSVFINANNYEGDWRNMANNLNNFIKVIDAPITEVCDVLTLVANADFNTTIDGNYKGKFKVMKDTVNTTISNTSMYIKDINSILERISRQDLQITITKDYIGEFQHIKTALEVIIDNFNILISDMVSSSKQVSAGAALISDTSISLAQGATTQAIEIESLKKNIDTITKQTLYNADYARQANQLTIDSKEDGVVGKEEMDNMLKSMKDIEDASLNISKIIKTIEDISFQTNLLALNAAVEAARAGTHGKGFAVVAEEVRNLATRSQKATLETAELINRTVDIIAKGSDNANSTSNALNEMVTKISTISELIYKVSVASDSQENALKEINNSVDQIYNVTQTNTATSEEVASSSEELYSQSEVLNSTISKFKTFENSGMFLDKAF